MLGQESRVHCSESLSCKVNADIMQEGFIVEEGVMAMPDKCFRRGEVLMLQ
jgi:hypothetical protein